MIRNLLLICTLGIALGGCATQAFSPLAEVSQASTTASVPIKGITEVRSALACIARSGVYRNLRGAVTPWADGTGKANYVASGGPNGAILPQATTASFVTQALRLAGVQVQDFYSMAGEQNLRALGLQTLSNALARLTSTNEPHFFVNGSWVGQDIGGPSADVNVQVAGLGANGSIRRSTVAQAVEIVKPGTRAVLGQSMLKRHMYSWSAGPTFGRFFGATLVTGEAKVGYQQPMQLESAEYMVALGVAEALSEHPKMPAPCRQQVLTLLGEAGVGT